MPFKKKNTLGFLPKNTIALDRKPLTIKLGVGIREQVMSIDFWQDELREVIQTWLEGKVDQDDKV
ncbi:MAG: hypothetical protein HWQ41_10545 [Nostoc sp. NOS(2021)]|uniref:hypothetical protein n=1 Tax=Nostoc sp. NOS(2021) TaxID=2815407 RepID=UPI0025FF7835|nr:hypothetical protein [Nostoc sp. NOS(2021)]MBN3895684.1 hypothetical protein [Nostoc sp. NOS(2021)]